MKFYANPSNGHQAKNINQWNVIEKGDVKRF